MYRVVRALALIAAVFVLPSCVERPSSARDAVIVNVLSADNAPWLYREPELSRQKYRKMANSRYEFMRGSAALYTWDLQRSGAYPSAYGTAESSLVVTIGDAHPENLGAYLDGGGTLRIAFNDFDGANWGPWHFEVRRLATTFALAALDAYEAADSAGVNGDSFIELALSAGEAAVLGYVDEIAQLRAGAQPTEVHEHSALGAVFTDVVEEAREEGDLREELLDYTEVIDGQRRLRSGTLRIPSNGYAVRELVAMSIDEVLMLQEVLEQWPDEIVDPSLAEEIRTYRLVDARRRLGAGVSSFPLLRYYALLQGPSGDPDDVLIVDVKEARDAPTYVGQVREPEQLFQTNAERSVVLQRAFQQVVDADPLLGFGRSGGISFRVQSLTKYQNDLGVDDIRSGIGTGRYSRDDLEYAAELAGRLLAAGHARAPTLNGGVGLIAISDALDDDPGGFVIETMEFAETYLSQTIEDYSRFVRLLDATGPLLGFFGDAE